MQQRYKSNHDGSEFIDYFKIVFYEGSSSSLFISKLFMEHFKLPENKLSLLGLNIVFIAFWLPLGSFLAGKMALLGFFFLGPILSSWLQDVIILFPIIFVTRYIWVGSWSFHRKVRVTRSKDE